MYKIGENEMVLCPYNRSHAVSKLRLQKHIIKCKSHYPEVKLVTCFYNYTHRLRPEDVLKHYEICSHKMRMEEARYCESNRQISSTSSLTNDKCLSNSEDNERGSSCNYKSNVVKNSVKSDSTWNSTPKPVAISTNMPKSRVFENQSVSGIGNDDEDDDDGEDSKPLNLPKTVSKAFTNVKQPKEKSSDSVSYSKFEVCKLKEFGRGKSFVIPPARPPRTNDHLLPDVSDKDNGVPKKIKPKYFLKNISDTGNSSSASVISSLFDDGTTLKSDDITFDDDDNDGFIFKNFDKYIRIM